jgi:large subunit ribosomal protein L3
MNIRKTLLGRKRGMGQIFRPDGTRVAVTAIEVGPCTVLRVKSSSGKDRYDAIQLGFDEKPARLVRKPESGAFAKAGVTPKRVVREIRVNADEVAQYQVGQVLTVEQFEPGQRVDVIGRSKGRGFQGVVKRHGFKGAASYTHGTHEYERHPGSISSNTFPARVFRGHRMGGHMGDARSTNQFLEVVRVEPDDNLLLVKGAVPGARNGLVMVRETVKRPAP